MLKPPLHLFTYVRTIIISYAMDLPYVHIWHTMSPLDFDFSQKPNNICFVVIIAQFWVFLYRSCTYYKWKVKLFGSSAQLEIFFV